MLQSWREEFPPLLPAWLDAVLFLCCSDLASQAEEVVLHLTDWHFDIILTAKRIQAGIWLLVLGKLERVTHSVFQELK